MNIDQLKPNKVLRGPIFPEPVQIIVVIPMGDAVKLVGKGVNTSRVYEPILTLDKLAALETTPDIQPFDGQGQCLAMDMWFIEREKNLFAGHLRRDFLSSRA